MNYWLTKTEPGTYSWDDLVRDKKTTWDGVRNYQARNNLKSMKKGDLVFIYHSGEEKAIVGIATVSKEFFPDPQDSEWVAVELSHHKKLEKNITLAQVKSDKRLAGMALVKASRLSVQPVKKEEYDSVLLLSEG
ncbi:MAG: EVE domain-containing protein [Bacteroidetes bacterium]|nr:EVE domain-containing protein [Bacteroidota bacterium]MBS1539400.1 EVE domain-containing protein [Bacteroidota bacterium]